MIYVVFFDEMLNMIYVDCYILSNHIGAKKDKYSYMSLMLWKWHVTCGNGMEEIRSYSHQNLRYCTLNVNRHQITSLIVYYFPIVKNESRSKDNHTLLQKMNTISFLCIAKIVTIFILYFKIKEKNQMDFIFELYLIQIINQINVFQKKNQINVY